MAQHLKISRPASQLSLFLILFGISYLLFGVIQVLILKSNGISIENGLNFADPSIVKVLKWTQALSSIVVFLVPAGVFSYLTVSENRLRFLGFVHPEKNVMYPLSAVTLIFALPMVFWLGALNQQLPLPSWVTDLEAAAEKQMEAFLTLKTPLDIFINIFIIALLPAIGEELCFRGVLQRIIIHMTKNPLVGIVIAAFLFSALHFQFAGFLPRMMLGIVLGILYWYSGSLWTSILAHFVNNALQVIVVSYMPRFISENPVIPMFPAVVSFLAVLALIYYFRKESTNTYEKVYGSASATSAL